MATYNKKVELKRVNMNLPITLIQRVEEYALSLGVNTTNAYIYLLNQALDNKDALNNLSVIMSLFNEFQKQGLDKENKQTQIIKEIE